MVLVAIASCHVVLVAIATCHVICHMMCHVTPRMGGGFLQDILIRDLR